MEKQLIKKMIIDAMPDKPLTIKNIRETPGGITNTSYFVTIDDEDWVVRIPGFGTDVLVNRKEEKDNLLFGTELGINPPMLLFDDDTSLKITRKIKGANPLTPELAREGQTMKQIIHLFKHLHNATTPMKNEFKLFDLMRHYESLITEVNDITMGKLSLLKKDIIVLKTIYESLCVPLVPCHIDSICANIIQGDSDDIYLIDWEYSGMFDPLWDIALLFLSLELQDEEQLFFLTQYLGRKPSGEELQRILMHTIFQDYLWSLWAYIKDGWGDDVGWDKMARIKRAMENMEHYHQQYETEIVG